MKNAPKKIANMRSVPNLGCYAPMGFENAMLSFRIIYEPQEICVASPCVNSGTFHWAGSVLPHGSTST